MGKPSLSSDQVLSIPDLLLSGMTWQQAADHLGVSRNVVQRLIAGSTYLDLQTQFQKKMEAVPRLGGEIPSHKRCTKCRRLLPNDAEHFQAISRRTRFESRCLSCKREINNSRYREVKIEALEHYSGNDKPVCACCGEDTFEFLSIDHINGGGSKHRQEIKGRYSSIYLWLKRQRYPDGFRVLCMNCNSALGYYGYCPHQKK